MIGPEQNRHRIMAGLAAVCLTLTPTASVFAQPAVPEESLSLEELINLPEEDLAKVDIATMNLAAAEGLPGSENIDSKVVLQTLDAWARGVAALTLHDAHLFQSHPEDYDGSPAKFCAYNLLSTLQLYLGVHYNYEQRTNPSLARSQDQFIHGIVQGTGGTCASLPVLYVAVGRRLGYPLKLAQASSHYYVRWDDLVTGECFNIDGSGDGYSFAPDDHYKQWPHPLSPESLERGNYLKSMSPREELSVFLTTRGDCQRENGLWVEALRSYQEAVELAPRNLFAMDLRDSTARVLRYGPDSGTKVGVAFQRQEQRLRTDPRVMIPGLPAIPPAHGVSVRRPGNRSTTGQC